jgi:hypothetical protein
MSSEQPRGDFGFPPLREFLEAGCWFLHLLSPWYGTALL